MIIDLKLIDARVFQYILEIIFFLLAKDDKPKNKETVWCVRGIPFLCRRQTKNKQCFMHNSMSVYLEKFRVEDSFFHLKFKTYAKHLHTVTKDLFILISIAAYGRKITSYIRNQVSGLHYLNLLLFSWMFGFCGWSSSDVCMEKPTLKKNVTTRQYIRNRLLSSNNQLKH